MGLLHLRAEEAASDLDLERLRLESGPLTEIEEGSELLLAIRLDPGHSEQPRRARSQHA